MKQDRDVERQQDPSARHGEFSLLTLLYPIKCQCWQAGRLAIRCGLIDVSVNSQSNDLHVSGVPSVNSDTVRVQLATFKREEAVLPVFKPHAVARLQSGTVFSNNRVRLVWPPS